MNNRRSLKCNVQAHSRGFNASVLNESYSKGGQQTAHVFDVRPRPATTQESAQVLG